MVAGVGQDVGGLDWIVFRGRKNPSYEQATRDTDKNVRSRLITQEVISIMS